MVLLLSYVLCVCVCGFSYFSSCPETMLIDMKKKSKEGTRVKGQLLCSASTVIKYWKTSSATGRFIIIKDKIMGNLGQIKK